MNNIKMYTSADNGAEVLTFPIVPKEIPEICDEWNHETIEGSGRTMTIIGRRQRKKLTLELLLPVAGFSEGRYKHINSTAVSGEKYIDFWQRRSEEKIPMRLVITRGSQTILNIAYTVSSLKWQYNKIQDIEASIEIAEYLFEEDPSEEEDETTYSFTAVKLSYNGRGFTVSGISVDGSYIVPVREVLEYCGYTVSWDGSEKAVYWKKDGNTLNKYAAEFEIINGTSYSYVREMAVCVGLTVSWDADTKTVILED